MILTTANEAETAGTCFAKQNRSCRALISKKCAGCRFYRSREDNEKNIKSANERLQSLPPEELLYIRQKYYPGAELL